MVEYIYILALEDHCFYVGRSSDPQARLRDHIDGKGKGSTWTSVHKPIKIIAIIQSVFREEEDMWTKKLMGHFSIHQVRGGAYSQVQLRFDQIFFLEIELRNSKNQCFACGRKGHFIPQCSIKLQTPYEISRYLQAFKLRHQTERKKLSLLINKKNFDKEIQAEWIQFKDNYLKALPSLQNLHSQNGYCFKDFEQKKTVESIINPQNHQSLESNKAACKASFQAMMRDLLKGYGFEMVEKKDSPDVKVQTALEERGMPNSPRDSQQREIKRLRDDESQHQLQGLSKPVKKIKKDQQKSQPSFFNKILGYITNFKFFGK